MPELARLFIINQNLKVFNIFAGGADEMGTYIRILRDYLFEEISRRTKMQEEYSTSISELKSQIASLTIQAEKKKELEDSVQKLEKERNQLSRELLRYKPPDIYESVKKAFDLGSISGLTSAAEAAQMLGSFGAAEKIKAIEALHAADEAHRKRIDAALSADEANRKHIAAILSAGGNTRNPAA